MNRKVFLWPASLLAFLVSLCSGNINAFILLENPDPTLPVPVVSTNRVSEHEHQLIDALERITGLQLEIRNHYLRTKDPEPLPLMYASTNMNAVFRQSSSSDQRWSWTARQLLLSALNSVNVYKVRENRNAPLGRVDSGQIIELDYADLNQIVYRDLPRETFDVGMIFFHELVHRHLKLTDPSKDEIKRDPRIKGATVEYVNRIERELGLPERKHYAPMKIRLVREDPKWGIYFGNGATRVEFDSYFKTR